MPVTPPDPLKILLAFYRTLVAELEAVSLLAAPGERERYERAITLAHASIAALEGHDRPVV